MASEFIVLVGKGKSRNRKMQISDALDMVPSGSESDVDDDFPDPPQKVFVPTTVTSEPKPSTSFQGMEKRSTPRPKASKRLFNSISSEDNDVEGQKVNVVSPSRTLKGVKNQSVAKVRNTKASVAQPKQTKRLLQPFPSSDSESDGDHYAYKSPSKVISFRFKSIGKTPPKVLRTETRKDEAVVTIDLDPEPHGDKHADGEVNTSGYSGNETIVQYANEGFEGIEPGGVGQAKGRDHDHDHVQSDSNMSTDDERIENFAVQTGNDGNESDGSDNLYYDEELNRHDNGDSYTSSPSANFDKDERNLEDELNGWKRLEEDTGPPHIFQFTGVPGIMDEGRGCSTPGEFFRLMFDDRMWEYMAMSTNEYVVNKKFKKTGDRRKYARLNGWKETDAQELKCFLAHLIVMGILKKPKIADYWTQNKFLATPFFGQLMSRNRFQSLLFNLHASDPQEENPRRGEEGHDPLFLVRPIVSMLENNFRTVYKPEKEISVDESSCPFKGRVNFNCDPRKPNRFHLKLFIVSEASSGYICGFEIYTGAQQTEDEKKKRVEKEKNEKEKGQVQNKQGLVAGSGRRNAGGKKNASQTPTGSKHKKSQKKNDLGNEPGKTTVTTLRVLHGANLLDQGYHVYFDTYYTSPELLLLLLGHKTHACGTLRSNRKGNSRAVEEAVLKYPGETVFRRKENLLAVKWQDKRSVMVLSSAHSANDLTMKKRASDDQILVKPEAIYLYNRYMAGVDLTDQMLQYYSFLRKSSKWTIKLMIHLINMAIQNAYILYRKTRCDIPRTITTLANFRLELANELLGRNLVSDSPTPSSVTSLTRLTGRHWPQTLRNPNKDAKKKNLSRFCVVCNLSAAERGKLGLAAERLPKRNYSSYQCDTCQVCLCIDPCFSIFHTKSDYKEAIIEILQRGNGLRA